MASQLKVDTITGVTTAGSISVTGEGNSTTTNLQQGLVKQWVRTFGAGKDLCSGQTFDEGNAANASTALGFVSSATSDGFVVTAGNHATASIRTLLQNITGKTYVGWGWKAGTSFTNDASATGIGTIDSSGSVSTDAGFSICSWVGTGSNGTIKHGLSTVPEMMIIKNTGHDTNWSVYTKPTGELGELRLNNTDAFTDDAVSESVLGLVNIWFCISLMLLSSEFASMSAASATEFTI